MKRYILLTMLLVLIAPTNSHLQTEAEIKEALCTSRAVDSTINTLIDDIRKDELGWGWEVLWSSKTRAFEKRFEQIKNKLSPSITMGVQLVRKKVPKLKTMGQALAITPELIGTTLMIITDQAMLNHIEFLLLSRRSTIATRLSIMVAVFFGSIGILSLIVAVWSNLSTRKRFMEIKEHYSELCSQQKPCQSGVSGGEEQLQLGSDSESDGFLNDSLDNKAQK